MYGTQAGELSPPKLQTAEPEYETFKFPNDQQDAQQDAQPYLVPDNRTYEVIGATPEKTADDNEYEVAGAVPDKKVEKQAEQELQSFEDTFSPQVVENPYVTEPTEEPDLGEDDDEQHTTL